MPFNIVIKADSSDAESKLQGVSTKLTEVEQKGGSAGAKVTGGLKDSAVAADKASESLKGAAESGFRLEGVGKTLAGQFGELGNVMQTLTSSSMVEAGALAALASEAVHLGDEYIELQNTALRLVGSYDQVDDAIKRQLALSEQVHGSLSQTIELSASIKEHTAEIGFTQEATTDLTKRWAEAVQVSGHSLGDASMAFEKFSFALQAGANGGVGLRQVLRDYPPILEALEKHYQTNLEGIMKLGHDGKLSMIDLKDALQEAGTTLDEEMNQRTETASEQWQHFKDEMTVTLGKIVEDTGAVKALGEAFRGLATLIEASLKPLQKLIEGIDWINKHNNTGDQGVGDFLRRIGGFGDINDITHQLEDQKKTIDELTAANEDFSRSFRGVADSEQEAADQWNKWLGDAAPKASQTLKEALGDPIRDIKQGLSDEQKLLQSITGPMDEIIKRERELGDLRADGKISADQYTVAINKETEAYHKLAIELAAAHVQNEADRINAMGAPVGAINLGAGAALLDKTASADKDPAKETKAWDEALKQYDEQVKSTAELLDKAFNPLTDQILKWTETGKFSFKEMAASIIDDIERMILKWLEMKAVESIASAFTDKGPSEQSLVDLFTNAYAHGGDVMVHAANGYSGTVGGYGATDSRLFMARVTPGEHIAIRTPQQMRDQEQAPAQAPQNVKVVAQIGKDDTLSHFDSPEGERIVFKMFRKFKGR